MKPLLISVILLLACSLSGLAQEKKKLYDPSLDGMEQVDQALAKAQAEDKFVFIQLGGNWCSWCYRLEDFIKQDTVMYKFIQQNFVVVHANYSQENQNKALMERLQFPQRFGFPVLVILDSQGNKLHTQDTALLESGSTYDKKKVVNFFKKWNPRALDPATYEARR
ncbi:MAG: thioredoxin family protein [Bacteroidota bacterium]